MLLLSQSQYCGRVKLRENGLSAMLQSGEVKSLDLWNQIGVGAVSLTLITIAEDCNVQAFQLELKKVNPDGPSLKFSAGFSVSKGQYQETSGLDFVAIPENISKTASILLDYSLRYPQLPLSRVMEWKVSYRECMKTP
jgi:hypothetical protein